VAVQHSVFDIDIPIWAASQCLNAWVQRIKFSAENHILYNNNS
jgi:hypothetical protein